MVLLGHLLASAGLVAPFCHCSLFTNPSPEFYSMTADFESMARARGLILPDVEKSATPGKQKVVWDGRAMQVIEEGAELDTTAKFTYHSGHKMVGYTEIPTAQTTKLIHGEHRAINTPAPTKEGDAWKPGCRYSNRVRIFLLKL